jgi:hypothetical protein
MGTVRSDKLALLMSHLGQKTGHASKVGFWRKADVRLNPEVVSANSAHRYASPRSSQSVGDNHARLPLFRCISGKKAKMTCVPSPITPCGDKNAAKYSSIGLPKASVDTVSSTTINKANATPPIANRDETSLVRRNFAVAQREANQLTVRMRGASIDTETISPRRGDKTKTRIMPSMKATKNTATK